MVNFERFWFYVNKEGRGESGQQHHKKGEKLTAKESEMKINTKTKQKITRFKQVGYIHSK